MGRLPKPKPKPVGGPPKKLAQKAKVNDEEPDNDHVAEGPPKKPGRKAKGNKNNPDNDPAAGKFRKDRDKKGAAKAMENDRGEAAEGAAGGKPTKSHKYGHERGVCVHFLN